MKLKCTNSNDVLYDELIPSIFNYLYVIEDKVETEPKKVPLIKYPKGADYFTFERLIISRFKKMRIW